MPKQRRYQRQEKQCKQYDSVVAYLYAKAFCTQRLDAGDDVQKHEEWYYEKQTHRRKFYKHEAVEQKAQQNKVNNFRNAYIFPHNAKAILSEILRTKTMLHNHYITHLCFFQPPLFQKSQEHKTEKNSQGHAYGVSRTLNIIISRLCEKQIE
jgi:hypothetical protein